MFYPEPHFYYIFNSRLTNFTNFHHAVGVFMQTICDGAVQYAEKIEKILEHNGYYDFIDNQLFDVTEQVTIAKRSIIDMCARRIQ